jgi:hypothetical protein
MSCWADGLNLTHLTAEQRRERGIVSLPETLLERQGVIGLRPQSEPRERCAWPGNLRPLAWSFSKRARDEYRSPAHRVCGQWPVP